MGAEQLRVTPYEGALSADIFGEKPKNTFCGSFLTCCNKTPNYVFVIDGEDVEGAVNGPGEKVNDSGLSLKKGKGNLSKNLEMSNLKINESPGGLDRTGI